MRIRNLLLIGSLVLSLVTLSANGDSRQQAGTHPYNPVVIESQIHDITIDGDTVTIHLYRQPRDIVAKKWLPVRSLDGRTMYAEDLQARDSVRIEGDLDPLAKIVYVNRVALQGREEHRP